jgi:hypothetical protein
MSNSVKAIKSFTLLKLKADGSNWILFQDSFELEVAAHNLKPHINGLSQVPTNPHPLVVGQPPLTQAKEEEVEAYQKELGKWTVGETTI